MRKLFLPFLGAIAIGASGLALRPTPTPQPAQPLLEASNIDPTTLAMLERSCQNCHSQRTEWPWYSHLPPASWLVHSDVNRARAHMNFSQWHNLTADERRTLLAEIGAVVRKGIMPPAHYTLLHPSSKLSRTERDRIYQWTRTERSRLALFTRTPPQSAEGH
jgi:hypothetical protein